MAVLPTTPLMPQGKDNPNYNPNAAPGTAGSLAPDAPVVTPVTPTTPAAPVVPVTPVTTTPDAPMIPSVALQPGNTGDNVKALQTYLVSQGYMTQDQVNTGYGIYGPQTTAAVQALQAKLGVDNTTGPGYFGPRTMAAISAARPVVTTSAGAGAGASTDSTTDMGGSSDIGDGTVTDTTTDTGDGTPDPYAGLDPVSKQVQMYTDTYKVLGLGDIKTQYEQVLKDQKELNDELNDKISDVQNDPWLSQGVADKTIQHLKSKYETRLNTLTNLETLYDSLYKQGQAQVDKIVTGANADIKAVNDLAQKQLDAANALAKDNQVVSVGGRELLVNKLTGKTVADLGPSKEGSKPSSIEEYEYAVKNDGYKGTYTQYSDRKAAANAPKSTVDERNASAISQFSSKFVAGAKLSNGVPVLDSEGFLTPEAFKAAIKDAPSVGLSREKFLAEFGSYLVGADGTVSSKYGLTPKEMKDIGATLREE